jgi:4'-phosphopantetheinyl transferase
MSNAVLATPIAETALDLWWFDLAGDPPADDPLSMDERARAARFQFAEHRDHFVAAHCALRVILGQYLQTAPAALQFTKAPQGKPALDTGTHGPGAPSYNLSHSKDQGALAIARNGSIGVDIEIGHPHTARAALLEMLAPQERAAAAVLGEAQLADAFRIAWTRKEACLKAVGSGFSVRPQRIEAGIGTAMQVVVIPAAAAAAPEGSPGDLAQTVHVVTLRSPAGTPTSVARVGQPITAIRTFRFPGMTRCPAGPPWD